MENVSLVPRSVHSKLLKTVKLGDGVELSYNLTTSMENTNSAWSTNNETVTFGRSFSYGGLPEDTETVTTINFPFVSVFYQMSSMPAWLKKF